MVQLVAPAPSVAPRSVRHQKLFRAVAIALSTSVGLLLAEGLLRVSGYSPSYVSAMGSFHEADEISGHRGKRDFAGRFKAPQFDVSIVHNEAGFRLQEHQNAAAATAARLFVFGDSFVWGWGVEQGEVFTDQMSLSMPDWWIDNRGINCTGTVAQYELFAHECRDQLRAGDTVLLTFFFNDFSDNVQGSRAAQWRDGQIVALPARSHLRPSLKRTMQEASYLFNYLSFLGNRLQQEVKLWRAKNKATELAEIAVESDAATAPNIGAAQAAPGATALPSRDATAHPSEAAEQIAIVKHYLAKWKDDCAARDVRFLVAYIPSEVELQEMDDPVMARNASAFRHAFFTCAHGLDIETIDFLPGMLAAKQTDGLERVAIPGDGHWNAAGHRIAAKIIQSRLTDASTARR